MSFISAIRTLAALTQFLRVTPDDNQDKLLDAQRDIFRALRGGQNLESFGVKSASLPAGTSAFISHLIALLSHEAGIPGVKLQVLQRPSGIRTSPDPTIMFRTGRGQTPSTTHGPFLDRVGRSIVFDVFTPIPFTPIQFSVGDPFMYISMSQIATDTPFATRLGPGSVWIPASIFTRNAPADSFFGLHLDSGGIMTPPLSPQTRTVNFNLAAAHDTNSNQPGLSVTIPTQVTFNFQQINGVISATLLSTADGGLSVLGAVIKLQRLAVDASYDSQNERLVFPMKSNVDDFNPTTSSFQLIKFSGTSKIAGAAWSLPLVTSAPRSFTNASGAGGLALALLGGLSANIAGQDNSVNCGNCILIAEPGSLVIGGQAGAAPKALQIIALGKDNGNQSGAGAPATTSFISFRSVSPLPFRFVGEGAGAESWGTYTNIKASLNQPRTINGDRVPFNEVSYLNLLKPSGSGVTTISLQGSRTADQSVVSYAIKNLLLKANLPTTLELLGDYDKGIITSGSVALGCDLRYTLPFLPDPYATNIALRLPDALGNAELGHMSMNLTWTPSIPMSIEISLPPRPLRSLETEGNNMVEAALDNLSWDPTFVEAQTRLQILPEAQLTM